MSMSTNIDDLPGPVPEELEYDEEEQEYDYENENDRYDSYENSYEEQDEDKPLTKELFFEQPPKIKMNIRKRKETFVDESDMFDTLKKEVNEENLLLVVFFYLATTSMADEYTKKLLNMVSFNVSSSLTLNIIKAVLLLVIFILAKYFILPYLRV